ncbi:MAG TPA: hypothetical protein VGY77_01680 [Gemmataceae bacterium]|nr:hypothetical protein [Gemmataceae bacterium]
MLEPRLAPTTDVLTYHNDDFLSGANRTETILNQANVNADQFGKLFSYPVDGYVYAQPLYKAGLVVPGRGTHNVVFVATEHDSVYAFDADNPNSATGGGLLWQRSFIDPSAGITPVPQPDLISADIVPEVGITGTPVIDASTNTLFVVAKTKEIVNGTAHYDQRIHALDIATGTERPGAPVLLGDTTGENNNVSPISVPGTGDGSSGGILSFNAKKEHQRTALTLSNGVVYISWASHGDNGPYHGWVVGYRAADLQLIKVFNTSPNGRAAGVWQSGGGIAVDTQGNLYFATGNGPFNAIPAGSQALGEGGGGLGYAGIPQSLAIKFDAFKPDGDHSSTGLYINGHRPNNPPDLSPGDVYVDLAGSPINFNAAAQSNPAHVFQVTLNYNGTALTETITDLNTNQSYSPSPYTVNIPALVGGSTAYVGFTAATGGLNAAQEVRSWTFGSAINHSGGFADHGDLTANGTTSFSGSVARLTDATNYQAGSLFSNNRVNISNFTTTFTLQMRAGSNPIADGMTFTIQNPQVGMEFGDSVLKVNPSGGMRMNVNDFFTPWDQAQLDAADADLGSGGTMLLPDAVGSSAHRQLLVETGKSGKIYLIDRADMGRYQRRGTQVDDVVQTLQLGAAGVWGNPAFFQTSANSGIIYYQGSGDVMKAFTISNGVLSGPTFQSRTAFLFPGSQPVISANGAANAIAWALQVDAYGTRGPAILHAYNALNLQQELYASNLTDRRDRLGGAVKFTVPTVADGHVFVGTQDSIAIFGLFPDATQRPAAPSNLSAAPLSDTQIQLSWTNNSQIASGIKIERSPDGINFNQIAIISRDLTTFTDSGLPGGTSFYYRIRATNRSGDSDYSNTANSQNGIPAAVVSLVNLSSSQVDLAWSRVANDHYEVERSDDGGTTFQVVATVPASVTGYSDQLLSPQAYQYRVRAFNVNPDDTSLSNVVSAIVGLPAILDYSSGFPANPTDLVANGSAQFAETTTRLNNNFGQSGSVFSNRRLGVRNFSNTFSIRLHEGTQPNPADGLTFTLQADNRGPNAQGTGGGGLGYQGIGNSVAIKFDVFDNEGETDNSTGIFFGGGFPGVAHNPGELIFPLNPSIVNLRDQHTKRIDMDYDGTRLQVTITDVSTGRSVNQVYIVDIPAKIGGDTAYVGFTGGTGNLFSLQDILNWRFEPRDPLPAAPTELRITSAANSQVDLAWNCNSFNEDGFVLERSSDGINFNAISTVGPNITSFVDASPLTGTSFYRARAFNSAGNSLFSNTVLSNPVEAFPFHTDVGHAGVPGDATFTGGIYTVRASGTDIWDQADSFQFLAQPLAGSGEIIARVGSLSNTNYWAKAGVMIRASLADTSRNVFMALTPNPHNEADFQWRDTPGGISQLRLTGVGSSPVPYWVRLVRTGDVFTGYKSSDGINWSLAGSVTIAMNPNVLIGLALTSHDNTVLNTATFDNVAIFSEYLATARLSVSAAPNAMAGTSITLTVTGRDPFNNRTSGYSGTVSFTSSDPQASLPGDYTFVSGDAGSKTFTMILGTAGVQTITAFDAATGAVSGTAVIRIDPGPATNFLVSGFPSPIAAGTPGTFTVTALDAFGNVATGYLGTVHFTSSDARAVFDPDYPFTVGDGGVAVFNATLNTVGLQSIVATDTVTQITGIQDNIQVDALAPSPGGGKRENPFAPSLVDATFEKFHWISPTNRNWFISGRRRTAILSTTPEQELLL